MSAHLSIVSKALVLKYVLLSAHVFFLYHHDLDLVCSSSHFATCTLVWLLVLLSSVGTLLVLRVC